MATIDKLLGKELEKITVPLGPNEGHPIREIFGVPCVLDWIKNVLPTLPTETGAGLSPKEELDDLLFNFISSEGRLVYNRMFKDLMPARDEVWELKTYQLRIFGWMYRKDQFIAVVPRRAVDVKRGSRGYEDAKRKVIDTRGRIPLDEPKFVGGVISNVISGL
jgi:hypothetical protein